MTYNAFIECTGILASQLAFLSNATDENPRYPYMNYIYIIPSENGEEGQLCGITTDGKRLHIVDPIDKLAEKFGLIPGYWRILKKTKKPIVWAARLDDTFDFPNYKKVMPTGEPVYQTTFSGFCYGSFTNRNYNGLAKFLHDFPDATAINLEYLHDLGTSFRWNVEWYGSNKALKFTDSNRTAVIMPMNF